MHEKMAKSILSPQNGMNIYRGCTHGCIYCDARSTCYQMQHKFEDIEVKINAPELLEQALRSKRKKCIIGTGAMSDPYVHAERELKLTRRCLEIIEYYGFGLSIQTKSDMILRDLDLLKKINKKAKCTVQMTMTTCDEKLCGIIEPNVCTTKRRAEVLNIMGDEGIPTICWMTPTLPFINDTEENILGILDYCIKAKVYGLLFFDIGVTLRDGDRQFFYSKLDKHFPGLKEKYIRTYGNNYIVPSPKNKELSQLVKEQCTNHGIIYDVNELFQYMRTYEEKEVAHQLSIFEL
ncbi:DNA repair photolyase [Hathewaya proteolytica DSM 3090]|uniref:DNA repair photolyase n=1 Tax=Hathewaya proteolytica DSM 3090 TaxID=1121331 RepID=A0A1M6RI11_9CLOT|nr:radical SAM protein [Hathewaya proteolytica]SHK31997.1 DNA repair photolyase [Hathewaya proteolytica DSM 3090]